MVVDELPVARFADAVALWHAAGLTRPWNDPAADLRRAMEGASSTILAVVDDEAGLLATAMVGHDGHRGWVYYLAVRSEHRGRGLAGRVMAACEAWVRAQGVPKIQLMVRQDNVDALRFYAALGYERSEVAVLARWLDGDRDGDPAADGGAGG